MSNAGYRAFSEAQQNALLGEIMKWGIAHRYHAVLGTESGDPACPPSAPMRQIAGIE